MRIAWIKMGGLWPLDTGGRLRTFQTLRALSRRHEVVLLTTAGPSDDALGLRARLSDCARVVSIPFAADKVGTAGFVRALVRSWMSKYPVDLFRWRAPAVRRVAADLLAAEHFDVVVADFLVSAPNVPRVTSPPLVFFAHNVEHQIWRRLATVERAWWKRLLLAIEWRKMRRCEAAAVRDADATIAVSDDDAAMLRALAPGAAIDVVPTGVDTDYFTPDPGAEQPRHLVFCGSMDWYPNEDGMLDFAAHAWPQLRRMVPGVSMTVVGRNPSAAFKTAMAECGIVVTGTVDDVRPHVAAAQVYVVPLRVAGGTRLKMFEALSMGKAVVSTTIGAEGLGLTPGVHYQAADDATAMADAVARLLTDDARRRTLAREGCAFTRANYSWHTVAASFETALARAAAGADAAPSRVASVASA